MRAQRGRIMAEIVIRELNNEDIPQVKKLLQDMWLLHANNSSLLSKNELLRLNVEADLESVISDKNQIFLIALASDQIVGGVRGEIKNTPSFYKERKELYIDDLVVDPKFERQGVGTKLIGACLSFARELGVNLAIAKLYKFNTPTRKLFKSMGFEEDYSFFSKSNLK